MGRAGSAWWSVLRAVKNGEIRNNFGIGVDKGTRKLYNIGERR